MLTSCEMERQRDYEAFSSSVPIVIDNGSSSFRIGWAGEADPRLIFRNIVQRPRHKAAGETVTVVGDQNPSFLKYFDCTRSGPRSAFDSNVVFQFEIMEYVFDFAFDRLGANGQSEIDHPVLITECVCNPTQSRAKMAELLFETYGVPSIGFALDAALSYKYNEGRGVCEKDGLVISAGFNTTHVIPFLGGEPVLKACSRTNVGGFHVTDYMKQLLSLKYPHHASRLTWEKAEELKTNHCYVAEDYSSETMLFRTESKEAEEKTVCWQLPWVPPPVEEPVSEDELARKAAIKEKQGQRLREMAEAKRSIRINELENEQRGLEFLCRQLDQVPEDEVGAFLRETGYVSRSEIESSLAKVNQSLRKTKGDLTDTETETAEKYPLANVPDDVLTPDQLKEKKRQVFLKTTADGRQRAKQRRSEIESEKERLVLDEEEKRLENPQAYVESMRLKYNELNEKIEQRKRIKVSGNTTNNVTSAGVDRGERLNAAQRERMRLLTTAAFDRGKGEDNFGARDEDWQLYKLMSKDDDDDVDEDELELSRIAARLQEIDPEFVGNTHAPVDEPRIRPLTKEDFQVKILVERFRCPEILLQPNLIGIDQAGMDEMVGVTLRRLGDEETGSQLTRSILMTGGSCVFPGLIERVVAGIRMIRPCGDPIKVVRAMDPMLDAWRGAAQYAALDGFRRQTFSREEYYEKGENWLRCYQFKYT